MTLAGWLDRVLYRRPFEGRGARRYATAARPAFGDLDDRLLDTLAPTLTAARRLLDLGAGPGTFALQAAMRHPALDIVAVDPSRHFASSPQPTVQVLRASGEALPLGDATIDVAICLSSIRHVRDRVATLRELRRVVRPGGGLVVIELDPAASATRIAAHADQIDSAVLRRLFGPVVCKTAPPARAILDLAESAGWHLVAKRDDAIQPVYILELD